MAGLHRTGPGRVHGCFWGARSVRAVCCTRHLETQSEDCPENESAFECDAGVKMSKFEAPIDVIGRRGSLNKGES